MPDIGSSPLARGLHGEEMYDYGPDRIIPARAGFTAPPPQPGHDRPDHPRSRGVYRARRPPPGATNGSSPLARGLLAGGLSAGIIARIIPARAGFTTSRTIRSVRRTDHPRSRGVYYSSSPWGSSAQGSSPLARGLPDGLDGGLHAAGIIPARAGFTRRRRGQGARRQDHPRSRGVYAPPHGGAGAVRGSSPLARGLPSGDHPAAGQERIIPARAGFTARAAVLAPLAGDHPRSRGVYPRITARGAASFGSSPLARGLRHRPPVVTGVPRIIPARAGFTPDAPSRRRPCADHPRSRGVYGCGTWAAQYADGSSPLARGLRTEVAAPPRRHRIIPARAGFTAL